MSENLERSSRLGPRLRSEVERQLLSDLRQYGIAVGEAALDWSESCIEGHATSYLDGMLHNFSNVAVVDKRGKLLASGWIDFIHGGGTNPLYVFWNQLTIFEDGDLRREKVLKSTPGIPRHVWEKLPESSKKLCTKSDSYDSMWSNDPLVLEWKKAGQKRSG